MTHDPAPQPVTLHTADALALEGDITAPPGATAAVVLCHPHPLHGGSMRSLVTSELFRLLPHAGVAALRFNFRGVGASEGSHGGGRAEQGDVVAAIDALAAAVPGVPLVVAGWSFGGDTSLAVVDERIDGWFAVAPTLRILEVDEYVAAHDPRPKVLAVPERDEFNPPERAEPLVADWTSTAVRVVPGADHFLVGRTTLLADWLTEWLTDWTGDRRR